jgi:phage gpG-like protein
VQAEARRFRDEGDLERSVRFRATAKGASVFSDLDYAPVHEWGGTIEPRGVPIRIPRRQFMNRGVADSRREIDGSVESLLDWIATEWERQSVAP